MCGIIGAYINKSNDLDVEKFNIIRDKLSYRGPDSGGTFNHNNIFLGHRRLSIIDLDTGNQPMFDAKGEISIVFNGEIYNFLTIKEELKTLGVIFKTNSDTEVILEGYLAWGLEDCLKRLEGMYAFSIWDNQKKKLFVVRDKFGEKPLYYTQDENGVYFASELKAIVPFIYKTKISKKALNLFFSLTYIPAPYTIYENVFKLEPGYFLEISDSGVQEKQFYNLLEQFEEARFPFISIYTLAVALWLA
jgi:asparagine synthase (glutamine-hydrolysing)